MTMQSKPLITTLWNIKQAAGSNNERVNAAIKLRNVFGADHFDDEKVQYSVIYEILGLDHAIWFLRAENEHMKECAMLAVILCALLPQETNVLARQSMKVLQNYRYNGKISRDIDNLIDKMDDQYSLVDDAMSGVSQSCTVFANGYTAQALSLALECVKMSDEPDGGEQPFKMASCKLVYMTYKKTRDALLSVLDLGSEIYPFGCRSALKSRYFDIVNKQLEFNFLLVVENDI